jgi:hypothetical protein
MRDAVVWYSGVVHDCCACCCLLVCVRGCRRMSLLGLLRTNFGGGQHLCTTACQRCQLVTLFRSSAYQKQA